MSVLSMAGTWTQHQTWDISGANPEFKISPFLHNIPECGVQSIEIYSDKTLGTSPPPNMTPGSAPDVTS